jgi:hypothetical protein
MHAHKVFNHLAAPIFAFAVAVQLLDLLVLCFLECGCDDKMMIHQITEEKPNIVADVLDEDEHMVILACLLQLHAKGG